MQQLAHFGVHLLETLFFFGVLGSLGVVSVSFVGDLRDLFGRDRNENA
jgi:hypothetical protein